MVALALAPGAGADNRPGTERSPRNPIGEAFPLVFDSESIWLDVVGDSLEVRGTFTLLCRTPIEESIPLFFPLPVDSLLGGARMVSLAFRDDAGAAVPTHWEELPNAPGVRWWVPPCWGDSIVAEVVYRQQIKTEYARYILTTARLWGRPLRWAGFEIRLPPGAEPLEFSYPFERRSEGGEVYYAYEVRDFFPDRDIVVRWRR
ncbi:MAG: hypothetical protein KJ970_13730 [Candidatus Eisenbacteria bacterium]|uniref:Uncharacterized protein n=1 Tax=Eiseniibacteriota bacterium TaxID=2212470 RepID=A0A948W786_UNCEI|nr:hypothetical protein [Candidatus Eisenbacteria bacterium]